MECSSEMAHDYEISVQKAAQGRVVVATCANCTYRAVMGRAKRRTFRAWLKDLFGRE